jgi:hypothetical protein
MKIKITRVIFAEIKDEDLEGLKKGLEVEDRHAGGVDMETDFDDEGKIVDYTCHTQHSTVEEDTSGTTEG